MTSSVRTNSPRREIHVFEPHKTGLPPIGPYVRELWRRKGFARELSRTTAHAASTDTVFGQLWLVINPLLMAMVYYLLIDVLGGGSQDPAMAKARFATLTSGLFLFQFIIGCMSQGAGAITGGGRLIMNTAFPKMLLTITTVYTAFRRYLPTLLVYCVIHLACGMPIGPQLIMMVPLLALALVTGLGLANLFATLQVYFRDTASFLPYFTRIWLYLSPVLWTVTQLHERSLHSHIFRLVDKYSFLNPVFGLLGAQSDILIEGKFPPLNLWLEAASWAFGLLIFGSVVLMSREREFAVRL